MPYRIAISLFPFPGYEVCYSVYKPLTFLDMPPDVRNIAVVKVAFSTFTTLSKYSSFFSFLFFDGLDSSA